MIASLPESTWFQRSRRISSWRIPVARASDTTGSNDRDLLTPQAASSAASCSEVNEMPISSLPPLGRRTPSSLICAQSLGKAALSHSLRSRSILIRPAARTPWLTPRKTPCGTPIAMIRDMNALDYDMRRSAADIARLIGLVEVGKKASHTQRHRVEKALHNRDGVGCEVVPRAKNKGLLLGS
jgi:hypothetical protein